MSLSGVLQSILPARTVGLCVAGAENRRRLSHMWAVMILGKCSQALKQELWDVLISGGGRRKAICLGSTHIAFGKGFYCLVVFLSPSDPLWEQEAGAGLGAAWASDAGAS